MNLTSKRMLQFIAGCAGVCALTATATTATNFVADSFEATDGSAGLPISSYKRVISGGGTTRKKITFAITPIEHFTGKPTTTADNKDSKPVGEWEL